MRLSMVLLLSAMVSLAAATRTGGEEPAAPGSSVELTIGGWDTVLAEVARHQGKVVLVDIWTTTCPTCLEELPHFVKLQQEFGAGRVQCITVNCDYDGVKTKPPAFYRPQVLKALTAHPPYVRNLMLDVALLDFLTQVELGSTPAVYVFDPNGKFLRRFDNDNAEQPEDEFTIGDVRELVRPLLKETSKDAGDGR